MGLFDRIWGAWKNMARGQPDDPEQQAAADAAEDQNIARGWPTQEQQDAADAAEQANIGAYPGEGEAPEEGEVEAPEGGEAAGGEGAEPEGGE